MKDKEKGSKLLRFRIIEHRLARTGNSTGNILCIRESSELGIIILCSKGV
jgi:hypothetical protein